MQHMIGGFMQDTSLRLWILRGSFVLLLVAAPLSSGCSAGESTAPAEETGLASEDNTTSVVPAYTIDEQVAIVTGRGDVDLTPIEGAEAWLDSTDLAAYVDPVSHDEFIVDVTREQLLRYDPGTTIYQDPINASMYPGEPSRDEVIALADEWAIEYTPEFDISKMRRTAFRRTSGQSNEGAMLEYQVEYHTYVGGVRMPEWVSVNVSLPTWTWVPSRSAFPHTEQYESVPPPATTAVEALETAIDATQYTGYSVKSIDLAYWKGGYQWNIELDNLDADPNQFGNHGAWVHVDAMTGELLGVASCG
ncbi:MAG: hypothetical protein PF636_01065 [Actinomycetota bacterium]|jgi:hypothetical protein|nr:hypothetical protein [Actinomycetota bacterium]